MSWPKVAHVSSAYPSPSTAQEALEGMPELWAEDCVDDGVERRVEVTQP